MTCTVQKY